VKEKAKGPVQILCEEIGFCFDLRMETPRLIVSFVEVLVDAVEEAHRIKFIAEGAAAPRIFECILAARSMLRKTENEALIAAATELHKLCHRQNPDDCYPTNHVINMLASCASAIRFGVEKDARWQSRHAAEAASHIWRIKYGVTLFDSLSPEWRKDWTRTCLQEAVLRLAFAKGEAAYALPPPQDRQKAAA